MPGQRASTTIDMRTTSNTTTLQEARDQAIRAADDLVAAGAALTP
ncbi:hypothetical protein ACFYUH_36915 [Streptomyces fimicarius]